MDDVQAGGPNGACWREQLGEFRNCNLKITFRTYLNINYTCMYRRVNCDILYMKPRSVEISALYSMSAVAMQ